MPVLPTAETAPASADPRAESLFDFLPIGAYRSLPNGRQVRANPALVRLNGYDTEAEMLAAVHDIAAEWYVDPNRRAEFRKRLERDGRRLDDEDGESALAVDPAQKGVHDQSDVAVALTQRRNLQDGDRDPVK